MALTTIPGEGADLVKVCADLPRNTTRLLTASYDFSWRFISFESLFAKVIADLPQTTTPSISTITG